MSNKIQALIDPKKISHIQIWHELMAHRDRIGKIQAQIWNLDRTIDRLHKKGEPIMENKNRKIYNDIEKIEVCLEVFSVSLRKQLSDLKDQLFREDK